MKFAFISEEKVAFPVQVLCRVLDVSTSGFYDHKKRATSHREKRDVALGSQIKALFNRSHRTYGSPRVHAELKAANVRVGRKRVARIMQENGLCAQVRRRFVATTDSSHAFPIANNILERDFTASEPNRSWVTDITFLWTSEGWLYLSVILDLFSRRIVGWATSENVDRHLALDALAMAIKERCPGEGLIHHSDRGSTYAATAYQVALREAQITCSMSRKGDCWDNAVAESFFATLKREMPRADSLPSRAVANILLREYIESFYNIRRRHSSIDYKSPIEFELLHSMNQKIA